MIKFFKNQKLLSKILVILLFFVLILSNLFIFLSKSTSAYSELPNITGKLFYIKNAYSGRYLDVSGAIAQQGTNVAQYEGNQTDAQKWIASYNNDGTYTFGTLVGKTISNGNTYINFVLDVNGGINGNGVNVQIWNPLGSDAQKFAIDQTSQGTYILRTKVSNYSKSVTVENAGCSNGNNIFQWQYNASHNDEWILEPVSKNVDLGINYARINFNKYVTAYPNVNSLGGDCANFVSQCMLASGIHYRDNWWIYRNNGNYSSPSNINELNNSWSLSDPSPWISAKEFGNYFKPNVNYYYATGKYISEHPSEVWNLPITSGDVIQFASNILGFLGSSEHTMYITGYGVYNGNSSYLLTYHSSSALDVNLLQICAAYPDKYFIFYDL